MTQRVPLVYKGLEPVRESIPVFQLIQMYCSKSYDKGNIYCGSNTLEP